MLCILKKHITYHVAPVHSVVNEIQHQLESDPCDGLASRLGRNLRSSKHHGNWEKIWPYESVGSMKDLNLKYNTIHIHEIYTLINAPFSILLYLYSPYFLQDPKPTDSISVISSGTWWLFQQRFYLRKINRVGNQQCSGSDRSNGNQGWRWWTCVLWKLFTSLLQRQAINTFLKQECRSNFGIWWHFIKQIVPKTPIKK